MGNGIYSPSTTTPVSTTTANTPRVLFSDSMAGGGLAAGNCLRWRAEFVGGGTVRFKINDVDLFAGAYDGWPIGNHDVFDIEVWRTGNNSALVRPWITDGNDMTLRHGGRYAIASGLAWNNAQTFEVVGESTVANGLTLERCGIAK